MSASASPTDLSDTEQIVRCVYEYAYGIDLNDFELYRSVFTDQVRMDFTSYSGGEAQSLAADDWVAHLKPLFLGLDSTQHSMTNPLVDVNGDSARCRMYMRAAHFLVDDPEPEFTIGGYYDDELARTADGWKISAVTLNVWWRRGNEAIMPAAIERGQATLQD